MPEKEIDRLRRQLQACHQTIRLTADDFDRLAGASGGPTEFQRDQLRRASQILRTFVRRQEGGQ